MRKRTLAKQRTRPPSRAEYLSIKAKKVYRSWDIQGILLYEATETRGFSEREIEEICEMIYQTQGNKLDPPWQTVSKLSLTLKSTIRQKALRILQWFQNRELTKEFL